MKNPMAMPDIVVMGIALRLLASAITAFHNFLIYPFYTPLDLDSYR